MKILYILSSFNKYSGTPKKTLDLINHSKNKSFLYVYYKNHLECKKDFAIRSEEIIEGYYNNNIYKHIRELLNFIDKNNIQVIQTQFFMGELLGSIIKILRPEIKLIITFVGSSSPKGIKYIFSSLFYRNTNYFIYISNYVKKEKINKFKVLKNKNSEVIYNGTSKRKILDNTKELALKSISLIDVASLIECKNAIILIEAINIIINIKKHKSIYLYLIGDGDKKDYLQKNIEKYNLQKNIFLLGKQEDIGAYLNNCDIFVHPCNIEGFGIAVAEAMLAEKPVILSNAGAHPELIVDKKSGLLIETFDKEEWVNAILELSNNKQMRDELAINAKKFALEKFSIQRYVSDHDNLYKRILEK